MHTSRHLRLELSFSAINGTTNGANSGSAASVRCSPAAKSARVILKATVGQGKGLR